MEADAQQVIGVRTIVKHPLFNAKTYSHDVALIKLKSPAKLTKYVAPVCLPINDTLMNGERAIITGWGSVEGEIHNKLQYAYHFFGALSLVSYTSILRWLK